MHSAFRTPTNDSRRTHQVFLTEDRPRLNQSFDDTFTRLSTPPSAIRTPALSKSPWRQDLPPKTPIFGDIEMDDKHTATVTTDSGHVYYVGQEFDQFATVFERTPELQVLDETTGSAVLYEQICAESVRQLEELEAANPNLQRTPQSNELSLWRAERDTWKLIQKIHGERMKRDNDVEVPDVDSPYTSDNTLVEHLIKTDSSFHEAYIVKEWLQEIAPPVHPVETRKGYWFYTQRSIREQKQRSFMHSHSTTIVTEVDPDAPTRQRKNLELEDAVYEQNFTKTLFEYIRRGRIDHAMNLCVESDQSWRAASLRGGILHQDPSLDDEIFSGIVEMKVPIGNRDRHLWKGTCYQFAQEETSDKYERAMYAALCGDVDHVLPVCTSWEDIVWTHYNALIESRIEKHLRRHGKMIHSELPVPTSADDLTVEEIFDRAKQSEPDDWRGSAVFPFHIIQAMIILNQTRPLIESMTDNLGAILQDPVHEASQISQPHMLRFMAHFISYLRSISVELDDAKADYIMQSYVELLIASRKNRIVALYATKLPHDLQVECYASFLTTINDEKRVRWEHVNIAYHYGLDVKTILVRTVEKIFSQAHSQEPELSGPEEALMLTKINDNIEPGDKVQIRALEWLTFEQSQHEDALYHSNSLIRHFLVSGKINAAREVMETLPHNLIFEEWTIDSDAHDDYSSLLKAVKEHLNYKNFLHCLDLYAQWAGLLYAKPSITGDSGLHMQQLNDWKANMRSKTRETEQELRRLLQSYWLMECYDKSDGEGMEDGVRNEELDQLRKIYIPQLVIRLHTILYETNDIIPENLKKSAGIAELVANENTLLYAEFMKSRQMPMLLKLLRQSSLDLLK